jgi:small subunit ribosomal protein S17
MECNDIKCPIHGSLKTHGHHIEGTMVSAKPTKTVIVEHSYTTFLKKYERSLRKHSRIAAHNPPCINAKAGDRVEIVGTRKLSKMKSFVVMKVLEKEGVEAK